MQNVKILILKNDAILISEVHQVDAELGEPDWKLVNPCQMRISDQATYDMRRWPVFTDQKEFMIQSDSVFTVIEKVKVEQIELYLKAIK